MFSHHSTFLFISMKNTLRNISRTNKNLKFCYLARPFARQTFANRRNDTIRHGWFLQINLRKSKAHSSVSLPRAAKITDWTYLLRFPTKDWRAQMPRWKTYSPIHVLLTRAAQTQQTIHSRHRRWLTNHDKPIITGFNHYSDDSQQMLTLKTTVSW